MWSNIKAAAEEHVLSENAKMYTLVLLADDHDEVAM